MTWCHQAASHYLSQYVTHIYVIMASQGHNESTYPMCGWHCVNLPDVWLALRQLTRCVAGTASTYPMCGWHCVNLPDVWLALRQLTRCVAGTASTYPMCGWHCVNLPDVWLALRQLTRCVAGTASTYPMSGWHCVNLPDVWLALRQLTRCVAGTASTYPMCGWHCVNLPDVWLALRQLTRCVAGTASTYPMCGWHCVNLPDVWLALPVSSSADVVHDVHMFAQNTEQTSLAMDTQPVLLSPVYGCNNDTADIHQEMTCCQVSYISCTKSQNLNVSRLILQLSLPNPLKPGVKSRMM